MPELNASELDEAVCPEQHQHDLMRMKIAEAQTRLRLRTDMEAVREVLEEEFAAFLTVPSPELLTRIGYLTGAYNTAWLDLNPWEMEHARAYYEMDELSG